MMSPKVLHKVFVYGTLKRGQPNHDWLSKAENGLSSFLGLANTKNKYPLVIASRFNIPYLVANPNIGENVEGEVYEVDDAMLSQLDILEVHPKYYERKMIPVIFQESKQAEDIWAYLLHNFKPSMLELPFLTSYSSTGAHGLTYVARYLRDVPGSEYWTDVKQSD